MGTPELLSPAGSYEAVIAAVGGGADAVYMGYGNYNARRRAKNLTGNELLQAVDYCRLRGVKTYITLNTLLTDRELLQVKEIITVLNRIGVDAVIAADLGLVRLIRSVAPELPIHGSTQMTVHNLDGVLFAARHGISRVVLARELTRDQIRYICENSPIETEVFVHGALCMSYSGQCYLSGIIGRRSGNRGLCAQPCRMAYHVNGRTIESYTLSLKDLCLAEKLTELRDIGVKSFKIEGRMKRPEYVAIVTSIYSKLIKEDRPPDKYELRLLNDVFSRQGFTDGYYSGETGKDMFGRHIENDDPGLSSLYREAQKSYREDTRRVNVRFYCIVQKGEQALLAAEDTDGNRYISRGDIPERAYTKPLSGSVVREQLKKTGGTPFKCVTAKVKVDEGISLPLSSINALRRECIEKLTEMRMFVRERAEGEFNPGYQLINERGAPVYTVYVSDFAQITDELIALGPEIIYVPLQCAVRNLKKLAEYNSKTIIAVGVPRVFKDDEKETVCSMLEKAYDAGITHALAGNVGGIEAARNLGFTVHGDFGLNVFNSQTLKELKAEGLVSAVLSSELTFPQIRDISKGIDTELIVYGRLPVMICENCIIKSGTGACLCKNANNLEDRTGAVFPILSEFGHRSVLYNSQKIVLADKQKDYADLGLWAARLMFSTENPRECVQVLERYLNKNNYMPSVYTRGLYYRGVE
jgi:putative protease